MKTIKLLDRSSLKLITRKLHPDTEIIEFGNIVCKDKHGVVVRTISLQRYVEGLIAEHQIAIVNK